MSIGVPPDFAPPPAAPIHVLVVDDERPIREILSDFLSLEGFVVHTAPDGEAGLACLAEHAVDVVLSDLKMPGMGGLALLAEIRTRYPQIITLMMTGYGTVETAIEAMKAGAADYVLKPFQVDSVVLTIQRALDARQVRRENIELKQALSLYSLAGHLGDTVELQPTLRLLVDTVQAQTGAERAAVVLLPTDDEAWDAAAAAGPGAALTLSDFTAEAQAGQAAVAAHGDAVWRWLVSTPRTEGTASVLLLPLMFDGRALGLLVALRTQGQFIEGDRKLAAILADRAAVAVKNAQLFETLERTFVSTIEAFVNALEEKDRYTAGHSERVAEFAQVTAEAMQLDPAFCELCYQGGRLHDIGKLTLRPEDLNKPAALTQDEYERFKAHPGFGEALMRPIPAFRHILPAVGGHHERWDGKGYPRGIAGYDIPLIARIMALADTYDAMTSHRAYRSALKHDVAIKEIRRCAGTQFDPEVVEGFLVGIERWRDARRRAGREYPR